MVDTGDLKSPGSNTVPVRVRSPAPRQNNTEGLAPPQAALQRLVGVVFPFRLETAALGFKTDFVMQKSMPCAHSAAPRFQGKAQGFVLRASGFLYVRVGREAEVRK